VETAVENRRGHSSATEEPGVANNVQSQQLNRIRSDRERERIERDLRFVSRKP
jgi:hypothetical protein